MSHGRTRCQKRFFVPRSRSHTFAARLDLPMPAMPRTTKKRGPGPGAVKASSSSRRPTNASTRGTSRSRSMNPEGAVVSGATRSTVSPAIAARTNPPRGSLPLVAVSASPTVVVRTPAASRTRTASARTCSRRREAARRPVSVRSYTFSRRRWPLTWATRSRTSPSWSSGSMN